MPYMDSPMASDDVKGSQGGFKDAASGTANLGKTAYSKVSQKSAKKIAEKRIAKEGAKAAATESIKNGLIATLSAAIGPEALLIIVIAAILIMIPVLLISAMPIGNLFQTNTTLEESENELAEAVQYSYNAEIQSAKAQIKKYVNENYSCDARNTDIYANGSSFVIDTDTCYITASFAPSISAMKQNISAYVNAVNGTLAYFGENTDKEVAEYENGAHNEIEKYDGKVIQSNADGSACLTDGAKAFYDAHSDETTNSSNSNYLESINPYASDFFVYDDNPNRWDMDNFHIAPKTHQELQIVGTEEIEVNGEIEEAPIYGLVDVTLDAWYGDIGIFIYYDLSSYRADELASCTKILSSKKTNLDYYLDSNSVVNAVLNEYYASYIGSFNGYYDESGNFNIGDDNRDALFKKLLDDGTLMYVPISGLSSNFLIGESGYSGAVVFNKYIDQSSLEIWKHINELRKSGLIGYRTSMWNCTAFAQCWFYELYGVNALYGNGRDMVNNLLSKNNELVGDWGYEHFYRGSSPAPGGIFSISSPAGANHVGCVDAVDFENKTITFSDGNTNGAANASSTISIKRTKTFEEFESYVKASCAHHGSTAGCTVTFANPKR